MITIFLLAFCLLLPLPCAAQDEEEAGAGARAERSEWTIDDVVNLELASDFEVSPDGAWVVWVKSRPDSEKDSHVSDLYLTSLGEEREIRLTRSADNDCSPRWRPDGRRIAFLSTRKVEGGGDVSGAQVWLIDPAGGEAWRLTGLQHGVGALAWLDDERLLVLAREDRSLREQRLKERKDDTIVVEDEGHFTPYRLFELTVEGNRLRRLSDNVLPIRRFALSHNGRYAIAVQATSPHDADPAVKPKYFLHDLQEGSSVEIFEDPLFYPFAFAWALDDSGFYFQRMHTSDYVNAGPGAEFLYRFDLESMEYEQVPLAHDWGLGRGFGVTRDGFVASLAAGAYMRFARYTRGEDGWSREWIEHEEEDNLFSLTLGADGETALAVFSAADSLPRLMSGRLEGARLAELRRFTRINTHLDNKRLSLAEVVSWTGALGDEVEGVLYYPHDYEEGRRYPLVLMIHGGPTGVDTDSFRESWSAYPNLMAGKGAFVLRPNYHGSGNYGQAWAESLRERYYELEIPDILNGVRHLVDEGLVDPDRLGVMGWSNGAILAIQLIVESPEMFRVAAPGAGEVNWISDYGNCAFGPTFDNYYFGGPPWERPEYYVERSPYFRLDRVRTPTIIFFGTRDTNVPTEQGWETFRALQLLGNAPVRFLLFPGEPHGLRKLSHKRRKMREEIAWFERYLFETYEAPNEAFREGSPLDLAIKLREVASVEGHYGEVHGDLLVPEVVASGDIRVGRFEVTRAQFAAFDPEYEYESGSGNFPVSGVGFERARQYCAWLSEATGAEWRLPTVAEAEALLRRARGNAAGENTLDYWAGYALNPDDAALLAVKVGELGGGPVLLLEVGSRKPFGEEVIFDLGGNVAEWCLEEDGGGEVRGGCAVLPRDERAPHRRPPDDYIGFRVVSVGAVVEDP